MWNNEESIGDLYNFSNIQYIEIGIFPVEFFLNKKAQEKRLLSMKIK